MLTDRRLIEDYLPIREISAEASREKSIRHGHISTLHLWWARRPLVASRAAVFGALVPAPETPEERQALRDEVIELCRWKASNEVIARAREHIRDAQGGQAPKILDMFAGGGAIPLEALRLGCEAYALDLNPVAHLIELCTLVYPQQYGPQLAKDVEKWGKWVLKQVKAEISDLYPPIPDPAASELEPASEQLTLPGTEPAARQLRMKGKMLNPVAYLWTRTVRCPNPACGAMVPLYRQTWLVKKKRRYIALKAIPDREAMRVRFSVVHSDAATEKQAIADFGFNPASIGSSGGNTTCPLCGAAVPGKYTRAEGRAMRMGLQPMAIVCTRSGERGKVYLSFDEYPDMLPDDDAISSRIDALCSEVGLTIPDEPIPPQGNAGAKTGIIFLYGMENFGDLFTPRQLLSILTFAKHIRAAHKKMLGQGIDSEQAKAIVTCLGLWINKLADFGNSLSHWHSSGEKISASYSRQALSMVWDFPEVNLLGDASGNAAAALGFTVEALHAVAATITVPATIHRGSATELPFPDEHFDALITDPPYYDNISYANCADFFYILLKKTVGHLYPEHFALQATPKKNEIVVVPYRHGKVEERARSFYESMMERSFSEARRVLKAGAPVVIIYAHKTTAGWSTLVSALRRVGFVITEAWPLDTEMRTRSVAQGTASLASSIFLVALRREGDAIGDYVRDVRPLLAEIVRERVETLMAEGISGADLVIATVGAGLRAYTQYARVELASGQELDAAAYLDEVQQEVAEVILEKVMGVDQRGVGGVDFRTRYYILGRYQYGPAQVPFDEANVLARGVGVELDAPGGLTSGRNPLVEKKKDKVRLRDYRERGEDEDLGLPHNGAKAPLIDVLHRLLWLAAHAPLEMPQFLTLAQPHAAQLRLVAQALAGRALVAEPTPGAMRDTRSAEQGAIDRLLAAWKRVVEENLFVT